MNFEHDIFISYGHLDDEDPAGEEKGWVDLLAERLPVLVAGHLGYKPKVWRDEHSLRGNARLRGTLEEAVKKSLLFVPVISPRYVRSPWCPIELEAFCASAPPEKFGADSNLSRIFKVVKKPLLLSQLGKKEPEQLHDLIGYSFYKMEGDMPVEFSPDVVDGKDQRYWNALGRLAWEIAKMLAELKPEGETMPRAAAPAPTPAPASAPVGGRTLFTAPKPAEPQAEARTAAADAAATKFVYLAETASDLDEVRVALSDELRQRGFGVLPEKSLPRDERLKTEEAVREALSRCALSVHLVGARYGTPPEDDATSIVQIQGELAAERGANDASFLRLIWMPPGLGAPPLEIKDARQKTYVAELQNRVTAGAELLQTTVEDLKTRVVEKLTPAPKSNGGGSVRRAPLKKVYLICENRDGPFVKPIRDYLFDQKFEVVALLDGRGDRPTEYHHKNLCECDAALIYFGNGDEPWLRKNLEDLEKAYGYGREDEWDASAVYVGQPPDVWKDGFRTHLVQYNIHNFSSFDPQDLSEFVSAVHAAEGGAR